MYACVCIVYRYRYVYNVGAVSWWGGGCVHGNAHGDGGGSKMCSWMPSWIQDAVVMVNEWMSVGSTLRSAAAGGGGGERERETEREVYWQSMEGAGGEGWRTRRMIAILSADRSVNSVWGRRGAFKGISGTLKHKALFLGLRETIWKPFWVS